MPVLRDLAHSRKILFFSGKGGVGKTTLASATALSVAREGARVLVVSTDPAHNLGHLWQQPVGTKPVTLWADQTVGEVVGLELDAEALATDHLDRVAATLRSFVSESMHRQVDQYIHLVRHAPGTHESALSEKIADLCVNGRAGFDLIVFDTAPTGHTARLMHMPEMMSTYSSALLTRRKRAREFADIATALGQEERDTSRDDQIAAVLEARQSLFEDFRSLLTDAETTAFVLALTAERMPVLETIDFAHELIGMSIAVGAAVINRRTPAGGGEVFDARHERESKYIEQLCDRLDAIPLAQIPLLAGEPTGVEALIELGQWL
ncbi:MAG: ArsA family ATPase [Actinomycetaceae bacterium]|nr:ArsA family ATPase [Actinomycetaceae bacterium]